MNMTVNHTRRTIWRGDRRFGIRANWCNCSKKSCGEGGRKTGYTIYLNTHVISVAFERPAKCNAPF